MKTYSRHNKLSISAAADPPAKRRRLADRNASNGSSDPILDGDAAASSAPVNTSPSSSPPHENTTNPCSDSTVPFSTPPSSPPPAHTSPIVPKRRPTFSFFARKASSTDHNSSKPQALHQRSINVSTPSPRTATAKAPKKQRRLTQLQLDLGTAPTQKTCKTCGMAYVPSNSEDATLHKSFHAMNVGGVELGRAFVKGLGPAQRVWEKGVDGDFVAVVGRRDGVGAKNRARKVLDVVQTELGAVEIGNAELWGQMCVGGEDAVSLAQKGNMKSEKKSEGQEREAARERVSKSQDPTPRADRFKAYLYIRGSKCIGLCLAERITEAHHVLPRTQPPAAQATPTSAAGVGQSGQAKEQQVAQPADTEAEEATPRSAPSRSPKRPKPASQPAAEPTAAPGGGTAVSSSSSGISTSPHPSPAHVGISRIWVSSSHRGAGVARALLDAAAGHFLFGGAVTRDRIAFSQPTDGGAKLARRWFGKEEGWLVYW